MAEENPVGDIWITEGGKFVVTENAEIIILVPELGTEPSAEWVEDPPVDHDTQWDVDE